jgi:toxin ParE1/3/4
MEIALYLEARAGQTTADRFLDAAAAAFLDLAAMPLMGSLAPGMPSQYQDVRTWPVPRFRNYIIFYRPLSDGVEIMRVVHGARDIAGLFTDDPP